MGVLILGNKSVVKRKSYITMLVFISTIIILFLIVNMNENSSKIKVKGGEGYGMFDKATRIEIIFNDNEYIVLCDFDGIGTIRDRVLADENPM